MPLAAVEDTTAKKRFQSNNRQPDDRESDDGQQDDLQ